MELLHILFNYLFIYFFIYLQDTSSMHLADGILRDLMMYRADHNGDHKLSADEIAWFYRHIVHYSEYVSKRYGDSFIAIADQNGDNLLNSHGEYNVCTCIIIYSPHIWTI